MQSPGLSIALFRIAFGLLWLDQAWTKAPWRISPEGKPFGWLYGWIQAEIKHPTFGFYKTFLENVVVPNFTFFGHASFLTEIALGISLLVGFLTVLGGIGGALWQVNIMLGSYSVPGEWYWIWPLLIWPHVIFAAARAGRVLGIDGILASRVLRDAQEKERTALGNLFFRLS